MQSTLEKVQKAIEVHGVQDIKCLFNLGANGASPTAVIDDVSNVLEKFFENKCVIVENFNHEINPSTFSLV